MSTATAPVPAPATKTLGGNAAYHNFHNDFIHVQDPREIMGRRRMYGLELMVIIFATLAQALASSSPAMMGAMNIVGIVIFWRVLMGVGIGGDYPLSSIITSGFPRPSGVLGAAFVMLFVTLGFQQSLVTSGVGNCTAGCAMAVDKMWRILIGLGAVPGCVALYYRLTIPETPGYTFDVAMDVEKAHDDVKAYMSGRHEGRPVEIARIAVQRQAVEVMQVQRAGWSDFLRHYAKPKNGLLLTGTALSWFSLDIAYYGLSLNNASRRATAPRCPCDSPHCRCAPGATGAAANPWLNHVLEIYALFMLCGVFSTLLIPETKRETLEKPAGDEDCASTTGVADVAKGTHGLGSAVLEKRTPEEWG
ncbi:hypothetical protein P8C59_000757 [Phyllachora maydis]|uniref:Uncharacterized protein n=1 Tax=Phyllachora maydis TaxID=1825666 RepID=A0AAD9HWS1_9PEZI|nr:hypothetical protein P8C59_000757 [Phyllachora maydis]